MLLLFVVLFVVRVLLAREVGVRRRRRARALRATRLQPQKRRSNPDQILTSSRCRRHAPAAPSKPRWRRWWLPSCRPVCVCVRCGASSGVRAVSQRAAAVADQASYPSSVGDVQRRMHTRAGVPFCARNRLHPFRASTPSYATPQLWPASAVKSEFDCRPALVSAAQGGARCTLAKGSARTQKIADACEAQKTQVTAVKLTDPRASATRARTSRPEVAVGERLRGES